MKTIWKFTLEVTDYQEIDLPEGARVLCVQTQHDRPCLWAVVDPDAELIPRGIHIFGTGQPNIDTSALGFVGTFIIHDGKFVGHVFQSAPLYDKKKEK